MNDQALAYELKIDGTTYTQEETQGVARIILDDHIDKITLLRIGFELNDNEAAADIDFGKEVELKLGDSSRKHFKGFVTGKKHLWRQGKEQLVIEAMGPMVKLASTRRTKVFEEKTDDAVASDVLGSLKGKVDGTTGTHKYILQRNESDLEFLKRLAGRNGFILRDNEGKIDFSKPEFGSVDLQITKGLISDHESHQSVLDVPASVLVHGWDYMTKEKITGEKSSVQGAVTAGASAPGEAGSWNIWSTPVHISDVLVSNTDIANAMAQGELDRRARRFLRGRTELGAGNAGIFAGAVVEFTELRDAYNGKGVVIGVRHLLEIGVRAITEFHWASTGKPV